MIQLALYRPHKWWDAGGRLVCWWTKSPYSHCELVVEGECYSSSIRDGGVRAKRIDLRQRHWVVIDLPWADTLRIKLHMAETDGARYGWLDLLTTQLFNSHREDSDKWFCSEWCATALGIPRAELYSPGLLAEYCQERNRHGH
ncbi:hypothetical protein [Aromatoleum anaerobium]|uniref:Uncharacterized protein n=1 Tax=Aromatoleum anaerobium TaxID=182180 RepID=A0ABX1PS43_9RHOO|nr:hypothetical protein [Aromatoleum anaerobium]MCK0507926.1 hypothetical protein [Aromatoleum anaerobium]